MSELQQFRKLEIMRHLLGNVCQVDRGRGVVASMSLSSFFEERHKLRMGLGAKYELFNLGVRVVMWHVAFLLSGLFVWLIMLAMNLNFGGFQASVGFAGMVMMYCA